MANIAHYQLESACDRFVVIRARAFRPIHGVKVFACPKDIYNNTVTYVLQCETAQTALELARKHGGSVAGIQSMLGVFDRIDFDWLRVGPESMCIMVNTSHRRGIPYRELRAWLERNCEGDISILSSTYQRRISFADESDFILAKLTYHRA